ncbi:MAG: hypothetical protein M3P40_03150 [Actinomycetota bacterium]|nr:hypothetical protein [Actinomycetota bacterium]
MRLILGTHHFSSLGGSETYLLTIAEQLERLGHDVVIFASEVGEMADLAAARGIRVTAALAALPEECDGVLSQDAVSALVLAERYPHQPLVFVVHGAGRELMVPPQLPGVVSAAVVMNDRVRERVEAMAAGHEVMRLRQPIDSDRFTTRVPIREQPRRLLLLGNNLRGLRKEMILSVCEELGLECLQVGRHGQARADPEIAINGADIVMGYGRSVLEGMACGRAAYVFDHLGGDGWVTRERYPVLEADGFGGRVDNDVIDTERLRRDLRCYEPEMGLANRDLVVHEHDANRHAQAIANAFERLAPRSPLMAPLAEMARLVRLQWQSDSRAGMLAVENEILTRQSRDEQERLAHEHDQLTREHELLALEQERRARSELERQLELVASLQNENAQVYAELDRVRQELATLKSTRRYKVAGGIAAPLDFARSRGNRRL